MNTKLLYPQVAKYIIIGDFLSNYEGDDDIDGDGGSNNDRDNNHKKTRDYIGSREFSWPAFVLESVPGNLCIDLL